MSDLDISLLRDLTFAEWVVFDDRVFDRKEAIGYLLDRLEAAESDIDNAVYDEEFANTIDRADRAESVIRNAYNAWHMETRERAIDILHTHLSAIRQT